MKSIIDIIILNNEIHAKWLNTLSFMENAGARKISACEDQVTVDLIQLKHAAEEHRHAYYLKKQIQKLVPDYCINYKVHELMAPGYTRQYLHRLDIEACRFLKNTFQLEGKELRYASYLFVTYAIEVRADELYPVYQEALDKAKSRVMVKSIILEEEGHLEEMIQQLENFHNEWELYAEEVLKIERRLFEDWLNAVEKEVVSYESSKALA
ncbi:hypothetical protein KRE40_18695 [Elizabethkingia meningoseptica]|uniref:hypothetical protein n=1 Tax=Elizabethkingia meningoseptica TaxID=238 RepID=UPI0023B07B19|nr:hypothetical protein [Elizabethkingia meningoseptica]MDE5437352.1 hypothetical protein [Elizabethkingia meningoseptica]MDE5510671.1 hypothetical protein [Elizabethkingia meningoseptica]MDE5514139.1 hypothetical protein [Elizabethkingia meningoseptica]MDE5524787.1 hypothetical protein [Elizabethkingia meningoseptica]MDE5528350.1 hypothetical protein [Elizabethkingia meningoseptica]